jgi:hypothetical protein
MTTLRQIIYDPIELLKQTVKDREIQPVQVAYWAIVMMNRLKGQHIEKRDSGRFLTVFPRVPVIVPATTVTPGIVAGRKYFDLPGLIFDFDKDGGIEYVAYASELSGCPPEYAYVRFTRTKPTYLINLYGLPETAPAPNNPYWSLAEKRVTLYGIESINVKFLEIGIYMPIEQFDTIDIDAPVEFPEELIAVLQRQLYDYGRLGLLFEPDKSADGTFDPNAAAPTQKIAPVNMTNNPE